ncbi:MAG: hypothetical protein WB511_06730 [Nitrososphaeraceae archaeon]
MDTNLGLVGSAACDDDVEDGSLDLYIQHTTPGIDIVQLAPITIW